MPLGAPLARELREARERLVVLERELAHAQAMIKDYATSRHLSNGQTLRMGLPMLMVDWRLARDTFCAIFDLLPRVKDPKVQQEIRRLIRTVIDHEHDRLGLAALSEIKETHPWPGT